VFSYMLQYLLRNTKNMY